jgi:hypothetical protein
MNKRTLQKIAFISMTTKFGGHEVMLARWLQEVHAQGAVQPVLWSGINPKLAEITAREGYEQIFAAPPARMLQRLPGAAHKLVLLTWLLLKFLRLRWAHGITVAVVSEGSLMGEPLATVAARLAFKSIHLYMPLVDSYHAQGYPDPDGATARFMRIYRHLPHSWITSSEAQSVLFRKWAGVTQPVHVLCNTVQDSIVKAAQSTQRERFSGNRIEILVLGRLVAHHKGLDWLLDYVKSNAQSLAEMGFSVHLVCDRPVKK